MIWLWVEFWVGVHFPLEFLPASRAAIEESNPSLVPLCLLYISFSGIMNTFFLSIVSWILISWYAWLHAFFTHWVVILIWKIASSNLDNLLVIYLMILFTLFPLFPVFWILMFSGWPSSFFHLSSTVLWKISLILFSSHSIEYFHFLYNILKFLMFLLPSECSFI